MVRSWLALVLSLLLMAPYPWGIAINHATRECGGYWRGDEYGTATLPEGWKDYYPDSDGVIRTEAGDCRFGSGPSADPEPCCLELGYTYVGPGVGKSRPSPLMLLALGVPICGGLVVLAAVVAVVLLARRARRRRRGEPANEAP